MCEGGGGVVCVRVEGEWCEGGGGVVCVRVEGEWCVCMCEGGRSVCGGVGLALEANKKIGLGICCRTARRGCV